MPSSHEALERVLAEELSRLRAAEEALEAERASIAVRLEHTRRRKQLVEALQQSSKTEQESGDVQVHDCATMPDNPRVVSPGQTRGIADMAYEILLARGSNPMYYEDLAKDVIAAGGNLGGQNPAQTLIARISGDPRFVRPRKRGWYAAAEFYPRVKSVGTRGPKGSAGTMRHRKGQHSRRGSASTSSHPLRTESADSLGRQA